MRNPFRLLKESQATKSIVQFYTGQALFSGSEYKNFVRNGYKKNPYAYSSIRTIAVSAAGVPWLVYRRQGKLLVEVTNPAIGSMDYRLQRLITRPNPRMGWSRFMEQMITFLELSGNSFIERNGPDGKPPMELYVLRPDRMRVIAGDSINPIRRYEYTAGGDPVKYELLPDGSFEILHLYYIDPESDFYGMSPLQPGMSSIDQNNSSKEWNVSLLQNSARPSGFLISKSQIDDPEFDKLKEELGLSYSGALNAGRPKLLEGDFTWQEAGMSPVDMNWLEGQKLSARETAIVTGVAPEIIGDSANKTHANYKEARQALYEENVLPKLDWIRDEFNNWLTPLFDEKLYIDYDKDSIEALSEDRNARWNRVSKARFLTCNEQRTEVGYDPVDGGNVILIPLNLVPLTTATFEYEPDDSGDKSLARVQAVKSKSWNLQSEDQKAAYWKAVNANRNAWLRSVSKTVAAQFDRERKRVVKAVGESNSQAAAISNARKQIKRKEWQQVYKTIYTTVARDFGNRVLEQITEAAKEKGIRIHRKTEEEELEAAYMDSVLQWVEDFTGENIVNVTDTTLAQIQAAIKQAFTDGLSIEEVAAKIDALYLEQIIPNRSTVIARTEIGIASNLGSYEAAYATGIGVEKQWVTMLDEAVREGEFDHASMHGVQIPIEEFYDVSGEQMQFPMDTSNGASAGNIIQCRCVEAYYIADTGEYVTIER